MKSTTKIILLSFITFGGYYLVVRSKAKKLSIKVNDKLTHSTNLSFAINDLINALGGKENILSISNTLSSITLDLQNKINIPRDIYAKFSINGISSSYNKYTIIFGDIAPAIADNIESIIK